MEPELLGHVRAGLTVVADVDLVEHIVAEFVEVRSALWVLKWNEVGDQVEEDVALANIGLDLLGQARMLLSLCRRSGRRGPQRG